MYRYIGNLRFQLWFDSPNHRAAFLVMTIMISIGLFLFFIDKKRRSAQILSWLFLAGAVLQGLGLALTYSRGGYIALTTTLLFVWFFSRKKRIFIFLLSFFVILLFTENGLDRVQSIAATEDGSIKHRLLLWEGGMNMIWNNLFSGVGADSVGRLYTAWYQPLWLNEAYRTLISDYLTIAAAYGIFALLGYLALVLTVLGLGLKLWRTTKSPLLISLLGALTAYLISALFTTFYCHWKVYWLFCFLFLIVTAIIARTIHYRQLKISLKDFLFPVACAFFLCLLLLLCGFWCERSVPYNFSVISCQFNGKSFELSKAYPRATSRAVILYLYSSDTDVYEKAVRRIVRPLLSRNYTVFTVGVDSGMEGLARAEYALKIAAEEASKNEYKLIIIGQGDGGKHAIVAASKANSLPVNAVVALGSPASWPFEQISPEAHLKGLKAPLRLIHGRNDEIYPYTDSVTLKKLCDKYEIPATLEIIDGTGADLDEKKDVIIELLDKLLANS